MTFVAAIVLVVTALFVGAFALGYELGRSDGERR